MYSIFFKANFFAVILLSLLFIESFSGCFPISNETLEVDPLLEDNDGDGVAEQSIDGTTLDCDDNNKNVYPGLTETCDGIDNNCNNNTDELFDNDDDTYLDSALCSGLNGELDCNDSNADINPSEYELCNGIDEDCDSLTDEDYDQDKDGFFSQCGNHKDCNDNDANIHFGVVEICTDTKDNDCDGETDKDTDNDKDGVTSCTGKDCDNSDPTVYPSAFELCSDGKDNDCNSSIDDTKVDSDGDGKNNCDGDCDEGNPNLFPDNAELCDGIDQDCSGGTGDIFVSKKTSSYGNKADFDTIYDAINSTLIKNDSTGKCVISVDSGTYSEKEIIITKGFYLKSEYGSNTTYIQLNKNFITITNNNKPITIDGFTFKQAPYSVLYIDYGSSIAIKNNIFEGVVIEDGYKQPQGVVAVGNVITSYNSDNVTIGNNLFERSYSTITSTNLLTFFGTVYAKNNEHLIIQDNFFIENDTSGGGALYIRDTTDLGIMRNYIYGNDGHILGGGILLFDNDDVDISYNIISSNKASDEDTTPPSGGGIFVFLSKDFEQKSYCNIYYNIIDHNESKAGAGLFLKRGLESITDTGDMQCATYDASIADKIKVSYNTFSDNDTTLNEFGALQICNTYPIVEDNIFSYTQQGYSVYFPSTINYDKSVSLFTDNVFADSKTSNLPTTYTYNFANSNESIIDPVYVNHSDINKPYDYHPSNETAKNAGAYAVEDWSLPAFDN